MKTLNTRWRLIVLIPLVAIAILSTGNRIGAVADQNKEVREAANEGGIWIGAGITQRQVFRFNVSRLASVVPGPPNSDAHPGGVNLELRVFDSQGNTVALHVFSNYQSGGHGLEWSFFDLDAEQLPAPAFDNSGRAQLTGIVRAIPGPHVTVVGGPPNCGFVASGEIFNIGIAETLVHIAGTPISVKRADGECHLLKLRENRPSFTWTDIYGGKNESRTNDKT